MLRKMIEDEVLYRAAVDDGLERDEKVRRELEELRRQTLVQAYLDRMQEKASQVSDEEAREFYEAHKDEYRTEDMVRVRILLNPSEHIVRRVREMVLDKSMTFEQACAKFSDNQFVVAAAGLVPTWVRRDRAVPWIVNHPEFHKVVFALKRDEISEPFQIPGSWVLARVEDTRPASQRTFEQVKGDVIGRISRARSTTSLPELLAGLKERYHVQVVDAQAGKTAEELFTEAQSAANPGQRVALYEELVERYPDDERAVDAHFMIGFLRSEELHDPEGARKSFEKVIELAPDSDLAQSARWMLTSEGEGSPAFDDDGGTGETREGSQ
jgi:peptidyl-prolyl cis-trans isomerase C